MDMRTLLKALMALRDENAYRLESRSSVPQPTISRFLAGKHGDPRPPTVSGDLDIISDNREKYAAQRVHAADLSQVIVAGKAVGWWTPRNS